MSVLNRMGGGSGRDSILRRLGSGQQVDPVEREQEDRAAVNDMSELQKGLRRSGYNALATTRAAVGGLAEPFAPEFADRQFDAARGIIESQPEYLQPEVRSFRDVNNLRSAVSYASGALGEGVGSFAPAIAAGLLTRGAAFRASPAVRNAAGFAGATAATFPQEAGETALSLRENPEAMANTTAGQRALLTLGRGAVSGALEAAVPTALGTNALAGASRRIAPGMQSALANIGRKTAAGVIGEAGTEAAQELTGQTAENIAARTSGFDTERVTEAAIRGAISGGALGGAGGTVQSIRSNIGEAADRGAEIVNDPEGPVNAVFEQLDRIISNPEEVGADLTNTTMGALADMAAQAGGVAEQVSEQAGPAMAGGMEAVSALRRNLDRGIMRRLTPENRARYRELTGNFTLLKPTEFTRLRDALNTGDAETINEAVGDVAAQFRERVPRETLQGIRNVGDWNRRFARGVTNAARDRRASASGYSRDEVIEFRNFLAEQYPSVLERVVLTQERPNEVLRNLMATRDKPDMPAETFQQLADGMRAAADVDVAELFAASKGTRAVRDAEVQEELASSTGDSQMDRLLSEAKAMFTPEVEEAFRENLERYGAVFNEDGELVSEEDRRTSAFNSRNQIRKILSADLLDGRLPQSPRAKAFVDDPAFNIPTTLRSDTLSARQIGQLFGGKDSFRRPDGKFDRRPVPVDDETIALRTTEDGGYRQKFNTMDIAAQAGTPQERGGSQENFAGFVPTFNDETGDVGLQAYRVLAAMSSLGADGIEISRDDIPPALLEEWGMDPQGRPDKDQRRCRPQRD
jgi:hypothetical protein